MSLKTNRIEQILSELIEKEPKKGLYVAATDIGNPLDITIHALVALQQADYVVCEERRKGSTLLKYFGIDKPILLLNEHNEKEQTKIIIEKMIQDELAVVLISDCGTPLFADPGNKLVRQCRYYNIPVFTLPGPSSLMAALMAAGLDNERFLYNGFLPAAKEDRILELKKMKHVTQTDIIFMETPYRLKAMLRDFRLILGNNRQGIIAYRLTFPEEKIISGSLGELYQRADSIPKGEFVFILLAEREKSKTTSRKY
jgi:16S rRNA (cytidine1402-2'-O)-methyltransferase